MEFTKPLRTKCPIPRLEVGQTVWLAGFPSSLSCRANYWRTRLNRRYRVEAEFKPTENGGEMVGANITRIA